jgi:hypothetical protein
MKQIHEYEITREAHAIRDSANRRGCGLGEMGHAFHDSALDLLLDAGLKCDALDYADSTSECKRHATHKREARILANEIRDRAVLLERIGA